MIRQIAVALLLLTPYAVTAGPASTYDKPDTLYATRVVIDMVEHSGGIWLATGRGINYSLDNGATWLLYDASNGLVSSDISALRSVNGRLWAASNHSELIAGAVETISDGVSFTDDDGETWTQVDFSSSGQNIPFVWGGARTVFDITGHYDATRNRTWLFFTAFAGGLLASQDNGATWRRIFLSRGDSLNFVNAYSGLDTLSLRNRFFSCVVDTSHGDSLYLWTGTAGGVLQYVYILPRDKFSAGNPLEIALCDSCGGGNKSWVYYGGLRGLARGNKRGGPYFTRTTDDGLPDNAISALIDFNGNILAGTYNAVTGSSTGLTLSVDSGDSYSLVSAPEFVGPLRRVRDFAVVRDRLYLAAEHGGLFESLDSGQSWTHHFVDSTDTMPTNMRNDVYALASLGDTLWVGTDSGLVSLFLDPSGTVDSSRFTVFAESDTSSGRVQRVRIQRYGLDLLGAYDSLAIWTINRPSTALGTPFVGRSSDRGLSWNYFQKQAFTGDLNFVGDRTYVVGEYGIRFDSLGSLNPVFPLIVTDSLDGSVRLFDTSIAVNPHPDTVLAVAVSGDSIIFAGNRGIAVSNNRGKKFSVHRPNYDSLSADIRIVHTRNTTYNIDSSGVSIGLTGNFIPALGIQYVPGRTARIFASGRPTQDGEEFGVSVARSIPLLDTLGDTISYRYRWDVVYPDNFAWNFAPDGDSVVYLAADDGLLELRGLFTAQFSIDTMTFVDSAGRVKLLPGTPVYAAQVVDSFLWVGTDDGTVRINLNHTGDKQLFVYVDPSEEVYAFPVPFSPNRGQTVDFHFPVDRDASVTLEVYDFAMKLVARPIDNVFYPAGIYPGNDAQGRTWDGLNGKGDMVAVGVYYIKVSYSTGEVKWGKLAVIP